MIGLFVLRFELTKTCKADAFGEKSLHRNPARLGTDRCAMRGTCPRKPSKMARKLSQIGGREMILWKAAIEERLLRCLLALLACLERGKPARPTAALPQISRMEPIKTPFPCPAALPWADCPAQRTASISQLARRTQEHRADHSGKDQSCVPRWARSGFGAHFRASAPLRFAF